MPNTNFTLIKPEDVIIDVGLAVKISNDNNPGLEKKTQLAVSKKVNVTVDNFTKWKKKAPKLIADLMNIAKECGCEIEDFVKLKKDS